MGHYRITTVFGISPWIYILPLCTDVELYRNDVVLLLNGGAIIVPFFDENLIYNE